MLKVTRKSTLKSKVEDIKIQFKELKKEAIGKIKECPID